MGKAWEELTAWPRASRARELSCVAALFLVLALFATWPLVTDPAGLSVSDRANNDVFLNQYLIFWGAHALTQEPGNLYHTNMFYPDRYGFAYADMLLTDSILLYPVIRAFYDPTLTYNVLLWLAIVIGGTGMYTLAKLLTASRGAALVAGVLFVANPTHFVRYRQPQFFNDGLLPWFLAVLLLWLASCGFWHRPGRSGATVTRPRRQSLILAAAAALLFCAHAQTGSHNAVFGLLLGSALVGYQVLQALLRGLRSRDSMPAGTRDFLLGAGAMALIGVLVLVPAFYPYFVVGDYLETQRIGETEAAARQLGGGSAGALELLTNSTHFYRWLDHVSGWPSKFFGREGGPAADLFPGFVLPLLALLALLPSRPPDPRASARRVLAGLLDLAILVGAAAPWITWAVGWRRLGSGFAPFPTVWLWPLLAAGCLAVRLLWLRNEPHGAVAMVRALPRDPDRRFWMFAALACFLAALGPSFGFFHLVHAIPGANLIRVPSRFVLPMVLALSVLAAWGARRLRHHNVLILLLAFFVLEASFAPLPTVSDPYPPDPATLWIAEQPGDFTVLEIPVDTGPTAATRQMLASIHHWQRLLIGYSGSAPPDYEDRMARFADRFPDPAILDELTDLGVRYLVVLELRAGPVLLARMRNEPRLVRARQFDGVSIWELR